MPMTRRQNHAGRARVRALTAVHEAKNAMEVLRKAARRLSDDDLDRLGGNSWYLYQSIFGGSWLLRALVEDMECDIDFAYQELAGSSPVRSQRGRTLAAQLGLPFD